MLLVALLAGCGTARSRRTSSTSRCASWSDLPPGGTADLIARVVADKLKDTLGVPVIVDNRPGAIGRIAAEAVKNAAPDGTTIMVMPIGPMAVVPHSTKNLNYDPLKDFTPIALGRDVPVRDRGGSGERREDLAGIRRPGSRRTRTRRRTRPRVPAACRTFSVCCFPPRLGVADAARRVQGIGGVHQRSDRRARFRPRSTRWPISPSCIAAARSASLPSSGAKRSTALPDVPTFKELGLTGVEATGWFGFFGPANMPKPDRRRAQSRHQQGAAVAGRRREADEDRHGSGDQHAGRIRENRRTGLREVGSRGQGFGFHDRIATGDAIVSVPGAAAFLQREQQPAGDDDGHAQRRPAIGQLVEDDDSRRASPRSSAGTRTASAATAGAFWNALTISQ